MRGSFPLTLSLSPRERGPVSQTPGNLMHLEARRPSTHDNNSKLRPWRRAVDGPSPPHTQPASLTLWRAEAIETLGIIGPMGIGEFRGAGGNGIGYNLGQDGIS